MLAIGLSNIFGVYQRLIKPVDSHNRKQVIGVSSIGNRANRFKRAGCTTTGTNVRNFAVTLTHRITHGNIAIGDVSPNCYHARLIVAVPRSVHHSVINHVPINHLKRPSSVTQIMKFLTTSSTNFVANTGVPIGNNCFVSF